MLSSAQNNTKRVENKDLVYTKAANHAFNFVSLVSALPQKLSIYCCMAFSCQHPKQLRA